MALLEWDKYWLKLHVSPVVVVGVPVGDVDLGHFAKSTLQDRENILVAIEFLGLFDGGLFPLDVAGEDSAPVTED